MTDKEKYNINKDVRFPPLVPMDVGKMADECDERWFNQTLCRVNECVVRLGVIQGEFHWHKHDEEDEVFYVVEGTLFVDLEHETFGLGPKQGIMVPRGILHRTRAPERVVMLMVEGGGVEPTGD